MENLKLGFPTARHVDQQGFQRLREKAEEWEEGIETQTTVRIWVFAVPFHKHSEQHFSPQKLWLRAVLKRKETKIKIKIKQTDSVTLSPTKQIKRQTTKQLLTTRQGVQVEYAFILVV